MAAPPVSPRGGADDGGALAAGGQHMVHQPAEQLHRHVLEGERRTVEQLQHEAVRRNLHQGRHRRMAKARIGLSDHRREILARDVVADEGLDDRLRDLRIGTSGKAGDGLTRQFRPGLGNVETAIRGKSGQKNVGKPENRRLAPGTDIFHGGDILQKVSLANRQRMQPPHRIARAGLLPVLRSGAGRIPSAVRYALASRRPACPGSPASSGQAPLGAAGRCSGPFLSRTLSPGSGPGKPDGLPAGLRVPGNKAPCPKTRERRRNSAVVRRGRLRWTASPARYRSWRAPGPTCCRARRRRRCLRPPAR